jgi:hypothetical protein
MTILDLKQKIKDIPDSMEVFIHQENDEFYLSLVETAKVTEAKFAEEDSSKAMATDNVFLLTDEI